MFENFPYSNFHDLNTDWIVKKIKDVETSEANAKASEQAAAGSATAAAQSAQASAQSAQASAQSASASAQSAEESAQSAQIASNNASLAHSYIENTSNQLSILQSRVNNIIPDGTQTQGNTELLDIRVGADGIIYNSAGDSVRNQITNIHDELMTRIANKTDITNTLTLIGKGYYNNPLVNHLDQWSANEATQTFKLSARKGEIYSVTGWNYYGCQLYFLYVPSTDKTIMQFPDTGDTQLYTNTFVLTQDCDIYFGTRTDRLNVFKVERVTYQFIAKTNINRLENKTALFFGDSICHGTSVGQQSPYYGWGWAGRIGTANNMDWHNLGISGRTVIYNETGESHDVVVAYQTYKNADYIILEACLNDGFQLVNKGTISSSYTEQFDNTESYCQAFEYMLQKCIEQWPSAKIGVIIPQKVMSQRIPQYQELAREICKKWSIPICDLFYNSSLVVQIPQQASIMFSDGETHLSDAGYDMITPKIESWMKSL